MDAPKRKVPNLRQLGDERESAVKFIFAHFKSLDSQRFQPQVSVLLQFKAVSLKKRYNNLIYSVVTYHEITLLERFVI